MPEVDVADLCRALAADTSLPAPPAELGFVGDGEYRAIGAEFLGHLVRLADLRPQERLLDIGCGTGRIAAPLTRYLDASGSYDGIDPVAAGIGWCRQTITPAYPAFRFHHLDVRHDLYNPGGALDPAGVTLPFGDAAFDVVLLTSVFTHLGAVATERYLAEIARVLRPDGRCFATFFLIDDQVRAALSQGRSRIDLDLSGAGPTWFMRGDAPLGAVGHDAEWVLSTGDRYGLRTRRRVSGSWPLNEPGETFQDIWVGVTDSSPARMDSAS
jgi:SAM-dependent methyltransferase